MNYSKKLLIYIFSIIFILIISPNYVKAEDDPFADKYAFCDNYQCITCEGYVNRCRFEWYVISDGKGGVYPRFKQEIKNGGPYETCSLTSIAVSSNFINSDKTSLICPNTFYYTHNYTNNGNVTLHIGNIYFEKNRMKGEKKGDISQVYTNNKPFKETKTENSDSSNSDNYLSCQYKTSLNNTTITITAIYNNGSLNYEVDNGFEYNMVKDLSPDLFKDGKCPSLSPYCFSNGNTHLCSLSTEANGNATLQEGKQSQSSDDINEQNNNIIDITEGGNYSCKDLACTKTYKYIKDIFFVIQIIVPILLLLFGSVDFLRAIIAQNDDDTKKAQSTFIKRGIVALAIFIIPSVMNLIFGFLTDIFDISTCGIGTKEEIVECSKN